MLSRRDLIGKAAVGAAGAVALGAARTGVAATRGLRAALPGGDAEASRATPEESEAPSRQGPPDASAAASQQPAEPEAIVAPPPWALVSPLVAGSLVAHGWRLADLSSVRDGSCVVTLENERERTRRVHLCRNDGTPQGI